MSSTEPTNDNEYSPKKNLLAKTLDQCIFRCTARLQFFSYLLEHF